MFTAFTASSCVLCVAGIRRLDQLFRHFHCVPFHMPVGVEEVHPFLVVVACFFVEHDRVGGGVEVQALAYVDVGTVVVDPGGLRVFGRVADVLRDRVIG